MPPNTVPMSRLRNDSPKAPAVAFAVRDLPVPGMPTINNPLRAGGPYVLAESLKAPARYALAANLSSRSARRVTISRTLVSAAMDMGGELFAVSMIC